MHIRDGDGGGGGGGGEEDERGKARPRKPPEKDRRDRGLAAARTMEVLRRSPLAIAQRLVHRAIAVGDGEVLLNVLRCQLTY